LAKRLIEFLRSVLPADPYQLLLLAGVLFLSIIHGVKWWPSAHTSPARVANSFGQLLVNAGNTLLLPIIFAAAAGWFVCFWPGKHPVRRISIFIILPVVVSIFLVLGSFFYLAGPPSSVFQSTSVFTSNGLRWIQTVAFKSFGLRIAAIGVSFVLLFVLRLAFGASSLPLTLYNTRAEDSGELGDWRLVLRLIWFLIALESLFGGAFIFLAVSALPDSAGKHWFSVAALNALTIMSFAIALLIAGACGRKTMRESIVVPKYKWTALAVFFPIAIEALMFLTQFGLSRFHCPFPTEGFPMDEFYLTNFSRSFFVLLLPAFFEEVVFRGLLQKRFIRRYGIYRGIFLLCIAWAAFHLHSDFAFRNDSYLQVFYRLSGRIGVTLCIGFVLSWLTLKSAGVVPATICHTLYNALVYSPPGMSNLRTIFWGAAAIILFRFWPPLSNGPSLKTIPPNDVSPQSGSISGNDAVAITA
jgi:membrane protease YdiL (CAAX protease family)